MNQNQNNSTCSVCHRDGLTIDEAARCCPQRHRVIQDESLLLQFIEWLPELRPNERFYFCLQARKKYAPFLKSSDKTQLRRFVSDKERMLEKIRQLECSVGSYTTKEGVAIPDEAMALYITLNPRDMRKATFAAAQSLIGMIRKQDTQPDMDLNPHSEALTQIHKAKSRSTFVHFDVDRPTGKDTDDNSPKCDLSTPAIYKRVVEVVGQEAVTIIETRGGVHVLIDPKLVVSETRNWHPIVCRTMECDQTGDLMVPVVGCNQGGFVPHFYEKIN